MNGENSEDIDEIIDFISKAYSNVDEYYLYPKSANGDINTQERIFSYEFYHQIRKLQESNQETNHYKFLKQSTLKIEGERVKNDKNIPEKLKKIPDFIVHKPGSNNNYLVMEFKKASSPKRGMENDLIKLKSFMDSSLKLNYKYGIFFIFGKEKSSSKQKSTDSSKGKNIDLTRLEKRLRNRFLDIIKSNHITHLITENRLIILWCYDGICKRFSNEGRWEKLRIDELKNTQSMFRIDNH